MTATRRDDPRFANRESRLPPHSIDTEAWLLGSMLIQPATTTEIANLLTPADFYKPAHQHLFHLLVHAHRHGLEGDYAWIERELTKAGSPMTQGDLIALQTATPTLSNYRRYATRIAQDALGRRLLNLAAQTAEQVYEGNTERALIDLRAQALAEGIRSDGPPEDLATLDEFLASHQPAEHQPWLIPGLLRPGWRAILVAPEGTGKSVVMRQLAVLPSQGVTPFDFQPMPPITTLMVDLENADDTIDLQARPIVERLRVQRGDNYESDRCWLWSRPAGLDLRQPSTRGELEAVIRHVHPHLVCFGPLYKAWGTKGLATYEDLALEVQQVLDDLRTRYTFALVMEHHAGKGDPISGRRTLDPSGSANWMRWPELGIKLIPKYPDGAPPSYRPRELTLGRFRHDRYPAAWPTRLLWNRNTGQHALSRPWIGEWDPDPDNPPSSRPAQHAF